MLFVVTVDTEADDQWTGGRPLETENVRFWAPFQALCDKHGFPPVYLITSEMAADARAQKLLGAWAGRRAAEVGAHLHVWTTPPFADLPGLRLNDPVHAYQSELPPDMVHAKLENLTRHIEQHLGVRPTAFRAGRFGMDGSSAKVLASLGYTVDSSVTPLMEWRRHPGLSDRPGPPDWRGHRAEPFLIEGTGGEPPREGGDVRTAAAEPLLEIPITIVPTYRLLRRFPALLPAYQLTPVRAVRRLLLRRWLSPQPIWLQPAPYFSVSDLCTAYDLHSGSSDVAVMMFHSSELMPGGSPYRRSEAAVGEMLAMLDRFFAHVARSGATGCTLSQAAEIVRGSGGLARRPL